jgi:hypothetical protein
MDGARQTVPPSLAQNARLSLSMVARTWAMAWAHVELTAEAVNGPTPGQGSAETEGNGVKKGIGATRGPPDTTTRARARASLTILITDHLQAMGTH